MASMAHTQAHAHAHAQAQARTQAHAQAHGARLAVPMMALDARSRCTPRLPALAPTATFPAGTRG